MSCKLVGEAPSGEANDLGLVTFSPDDIDWEGEVRLAIDERAGLSPDALTGMEASLRFGGAGDRVVESLRPALRLAELDFHPAQCGWRESGAEASPARKTGRIRQ
ncbi:MAG: hypothetical protein R3C55_13995 [Parvularculaceae bacterium]